MSDTPTQQFICVTPPFPSSTTAKMKMYPDTTSELVGKMEEMVCGKKQEDIFTYGKQQTVGKRGIRTVTSSASDPVASKFVDALMKKKACAIALADAEHSCQEWEFLLRHYAGEAAVQYAIQTNPFIDDRQGNTSGGRYIMAISRISLRDFSPPQGQPPIAD